MEVLKNEEEAAEVKTGSCVVADTQIGQKVKEITSFDIA